MPYIRFKLDLQNDLQRILYVYIYPPAVGICKRSSLCALTLFPTFTFFLCDMRNQRKKTLLVFALILLLLFIFLLRRLYVLRFLYD